MKTKSSNPALCFHLKAEEQQRIFKSINVKQERFRLPLSILKTSTSALKIPSTETETLVHASALITDKVSVHSSNALGTIILLLEIIMKRDTTLETKLLFLYVTSVEHTIFSQDCLFRQPLNIKRSECTRQKLLYLGICEEKDQTIS